MSIQKHEIPILEFDSDPSAVLEPGHEALDVHFPERAVFAFLQDTIEKYALQHGGKVLTHFLSATMQYPIFLLEENGIPFLLVQAPVGAAPAAQILDWLIAHGVKKVISSGSCGVLVHKEEGVFLVPKKALRDEGTSYHYLPPSRFVDIEEAPRKAIEKVLRSHHLPYEEVTTWSTDGFFRETKEKVEYRKSEACTVVEMECSALAAVAKMRDIQWGSLLYTGDSLANVEEHDMRSFGIGSREIALRLSIESVLEM